MRFRRVAVVVGTAILCFAAGSVPASAAADNDTLDVVGTMTDSRDDPPSPVAGVELNVTLDDEVVAEATSDADGRFVLPLPGETIDLLGETITVSIDTETLPEGASLTNEDRTSYDVVIRTDSDIPVNYRIGPERALGADLIGKVAQNAVNGVILGLLLALTALGLSLVFGTTGLTNFAHGELITFGALAAFLTQAWFGWSFLPAAGVAIVLAALLGLANDALLWKPLRRRGTGLIAMMIVSIGLAIFLRNVFQYIAGADSKVFRDVPIGRRSFELIGIDFSQRGLVSAAICVAVLVAVSVAVQRTKLGKATRAVSDNPPLAAASGIDVDRVIRTVWVVGAALAGTGGVLWGLNYGFDYQFGFKILLLVFASVILGGLGTIWGTMAGALIVGLTVELSTLVLPPEVKYVTALVVLIVVLLVRPQGLLGRAERVG